MISDYYVDLVEEYLGDLIEEVVYKYYSDKIDLELEYELLLSYIVQNLTDDEKYGDVNNFRELLRKLGRRKGVAKLVISYLVSQYIEDNYSNERGEI